MAEVTLSDGSVALVDDTDYALVSGRIWHPARDKNTVYARCSIGNKTVRMHRLIMSASGSDRVDHRDGNGLNNRRSNLRLATSQQNAANKHTRRSVSGFKGVYRAHRTDRWKAIITVNYRRRHIGSFSTAEQAAKAYDQVALKAFGEFADLNFPAGRTLDGRVHDDFPTVQQ